ncbi:hypothetical protein EVAR_10757_1 [Eumeta japonica]|uniref:Uncharacterized protein n=1 Tax=Eumeta variegata TaxID=151549 RepID=A0A4C1W8F3_EUMVA|nr:hypothetical protein EVAR_10757_1 [Eumeta japonica]
MRVDENDEAGFGNHTGQVFGYGQFFSNSSIPSAAESMPSTCEFYKLIRVRLTVNELSVINRANNIQHLVARALCCTNFADGGSLLPLSLFYSDASANRVEERSRVPRSRSLARLRRNATMSHAFSCVQPVFIDL